MPAHTTPQVFIAYAPEGPGLRCALLYFVAGEDLWGWVTGPQGDLLVSDYFHVAGFHALREPRYRAVDIAGLRSGWTPGAELARVQGEFVREWLFYRSAREARAYLERYDAAGLASGEVNVRYERLGRLRRSQPDWIYSSPDFEPAVVPWLSHRWALDYRPASVAVKRIDGPVVA